MRPAVGRGVSGPYTKWVASAQRLRNYPNSAVFNGSTTITSGQNTGIAGTTQSYTIAAVICPALPFNANGNTVVGIGSAGSSGVGAGLLIYGSGVATNPESFGIANYGVSYKCVTSQTIFAGVLTEVVVTFTSGTNAVAAYMNGHQYTLSSATMSPPNITNAPISIGGNSGTFPAIRGLINDVCIWNVPLTAKQVAQMWSTGIRPTQGLVRRYPLIDGSGTTPVDIAMATPVAGGGTVTTTNGSTSITFSASQTLAAGTPLIFSKQPGIRYWTAAAVSGASGTLTTAYNAGSGNDGSGQTCLTNDTSTSVGLTWQVNRQLT